MLKKSEHYKPNKAKVLTKELITKQSIPIIEKFATVFGIFCNCCSKELLTLGSRIKIYRLRNNVKEITNEKFLHSTNFLVETPNKHYAKYYL